MSAVSHYRRKSRGSRGWKFLILAALSAGGYTQWQRLAPKDPLALAWGTSINRNIDRLPAEGRIGVDQSPWADAAWTAAQGGGLLRYQREDLELSERSRKRPPTLEELKNLSMAARGRAISLLSPFEIFDLVRGQTLYPLVAEARRTVSPKNAMEFEERMNFGWAAAATMLQEPGQIDNHLLRLPTGHEARITIGASDVKAVAAYYYGKIARQHVRTARVGSRCFGKDDWNCNRVDPASFHLLLANTIQENGRAFVADIDPSAAVDYRPIVSYESDIRRDDDRHYAVTTVVDYVRRRLPQTGPYGIFNLDTEREVYRYTLEVDADRKIVGGQWITERRPEFVWRVLELPHVDHHGFSALRSIYRESPIRGAAGLAGI